MSYPEPARPTQAVAVPNHLDHLSLQRPSAGTDMVPAEGAGVRAFQVTSEIVAERPLIRRTRPGRPPLTSVMPLAGATAAPAALTPPANMAEVLLRLTALPSWSPRRQRDTMTAIRSLGRVVGKPLGDITTEPAQLRRLLTKAAPALAGIKPRRWTAMRSMVLTALRELGIDVMPGRAKNPLSPAWAALAAQLPGKDSRYGLSRILRFFSREGIEPSAVDAAALQQFHTALVATSLRGNPETAFGQTLSFWRVAAGSVPGWPTADLPSPPQSRRYALGADQFPASFCADVDAFSARSGNPDPFAEDYAPPVRATTVASRRKQIFQVASGLVASGMAIERIVSLGVLVEPQNAKAALRHLLDRKEGIKGTGLAQQALLLRTIARHWVKADERAVVKLRGFASGLAPKKEGMGTKNRERLRQFDLPANVQTLMALPARVLRQVQEGNTGSQADAIRVMFALAVEILIVAPMRVRNLCELDIDRHLIVTRRGRARHLHISIAKTKTDARFERGLPPQTIAMLDLFVGTYRQRVCDAPGSLLFPGRGGACRAVTRFSTAISEFICRETGLVMHPHLFRHLSIKLHLCRHPDDMETARLMLGHVSSATTERTYAENRTDHAFKRWDGTLAALRDEPGAPLTPGSNPSRRT